MLLSLVLDFCFFSETLSLAACWYRDDIEATKSRIAWCMDLLPPPIISTSSEILSPSLVKSSTSFSITLLLCSSGGDERDLSPFCFSGGEWSNLDALRKGFRKGLSCCVSFAPSVPAGEEAPVDLFKVFKLNSMLLGPNLKSLSWIRCVVTLTVVPWLSLQCREAMRGLTQVLMRACVQSQTGS